MAKRRKKIDRTHHQLDLFGRFRKLRVSSISKSTEGSLTIHDQLRQSMNLAIKEGKHSRWEIAGQMSHMLGVEVTKYMLDEGIYFPKSEKISRLARNRAIKSEFAGNNHRELARKYHLTVVMIRNILEEKQKTDVDIVNNQLSLFAVSDH